MTAKSTSPMEQRPDRVGRRRWLACLVIGLPLATACSNDGPADTPNDNGSEVTDETSDATDASSTGSVMFPNGTVIGETPSDASETTP